MLCFCLHSVSAGEPVPIKVAVTDVSLPKMLITAVMVVWVSCRC